MIGPKIAPGIAAQMPMSMPMQKPGSVRAQGVGQAAGPMSRRPAEPFAGPGSVKPTPDGSAGPLRQAGSPDISPRVGTPDPTALVAAPPRATLPASKASQSPEALWKAARDFEAMVIGQLLKPMFETVDNSKSPFSGGHGEQAFKPMILEEMAKKIAAGGGFGLAQPIYAQMLRMQEGARP